MPCRSDAPRPHSRGCKTTLVHQSQLACREQETSTRDPPTKSQCHCAPSTRGHVAGSRGCFVFSIEHCCVVWQLIDQTVPEVLLLSPLTAHISHLIALRLSASLCLYPWQPAFNNGESSGRRMGGKQYHGEKKQEIEGDGKLAGRLSRKGARRNESQGLRRTDAQVRMR